MQDHHGQEDVSMGNYSTIPISHTDKTHLIAFNYKFILPNTLCALDIKTHLNFVSKFCFDNNTSIEFFPSKFLVKDLTMGVPLAYGWNRQGLYEWPTKLQQHIFYCV